MVFNTLFFLFITDPAKVYCQSRIFHQREMGSGVQSQGLPRQNTGKESACQSRRCKFDPWVGKIPWRRKTATHSSILAWEIPWTEEPGGLQYVGLSRVTHVHTQWQRKGQVFTCFLWHLTGGSVAKTSSFQCREPRLDPWSGNQIPHAATKSLHATPKDPTCCNGD